MRKLIVLLNEFWQWTGTPKDKWGVIDILDLDFDPIYFPHFDKLRMACIELINTDLSIEDTNAFLMCLALDAEDEYILDQCRKRANVSFLEKLVQAGITNPQSEARWQVAELLRQPINNREYYLTKLLSDPNSYVRKRAGNVARDINEDQICKKEIPKTQ